ncbi:MAG TPA: TonB-dependent receptor [Candidatus Acidoferrum sp.]|nr:TonB-dependent receptor [Candidatus Acidoferrum sp.]
MRIGFRSVRLFVASLSLLCCASVGWAQSSGTIEGVVKDPSGAIVPNATIKIDNAVSGYSRSTSTAADGTFRFTNLPLNPYHLTVTAGKFAPNLVDVEVRSSVPAKVEVTLKLGTEATTVNVTENGGDLIENESTFHSDIDRNLFERTPLESSTSPFSSLVTLTTPGIAADSNGLMHGLGDHAENSVSLDGQPQTDQFSKVFSNQIPADSIQSMEVISGAPPADFGDKTSVVVKVTTRSGLGQNIPRGSIYSSYGSFGTVNAGFDVAYGGDKWGNFLAVNGLNTSRFLDPPEFTAMHDKGNAENVFDRIDFQLSQADTLHLNLGFTRSWFQNPNTYDQQFHLCGPIGYTCDPTNTFLINTVTGAPLGTTDQRTQIKSYNIAPSWTHLFGSNAVSTLGFFARHDQYNYYPSNNPLNDLAPDLQVETAGQDRQLTNVGLRGDISYVKGIHNIKVGFVYQQTFLTESDQLGIIDPTFLPSLNTANPDGTTIPNDPCFVNGKATGPPCTTLLPFDLTNGGKLFNFHGHTDVKELALYVMDTISWKNWSFNLGLRGDKYDGISTDGQVQPRLGIAYNIKPTNTVLRVSYARIMETPFNENLVIASNGCSDPVVVAIVSPPGVPCNLGALTPGYRNEFHAGFEQAFGKYLVINGEYIWKYTHDGFDFGIVGATPITFPIEWHNSKIPGWLLSATVPNFHGLTARVVMSGVAARFFNPQTAGIAFFPSFNVFRIDHDEHYNETTHIQYQPWKRGPWLGFNWRYDSGLVSGAVPCFAATATCGATTVPGTGGPGEPPALIALNNAITGLPLTADQEFQAGLTCNGVPVVSSPFGAPATSCLASQLGSKFINVPKPGTENDDHNPQRIAPRNLFDLAIGHDNLFHGDRYRWSLQLSMINMTNKTALYNFLSTFSGTHYVTPRTETAELAFHF